MAIAQQADALRSSAECHAQSMLQEIGVSHRPGARNLSVSAFQEAWNRLLPAVRGRADVLLPSKNGGALDVDGIYARQTSVAANNFVASPLPRYAGEVPVWFAQNQGFVASMCTPAPPAVVVPLPMQTAPAPVVPMVAVAPPAPAGGPPPLTPAAFAPTFPDDPVVEVGLPQVQPPVEVSPVAVAIAAAADPQAIKESMSQGPIAVVVEDAPGLTPENVQRLPGGRIMGQTGTGDVPFLAVAAGVLTVAGVAGFWLYRRRS